MELLKFNGAKLRDYISPDSLSLSVFYLICLLMVVFPWGNPGIPHAGSTIYAILIVGGLALGWNHFSELGFEERALLFACVALLGIVTLTLVNAENWDRGLNHVARYVRIAGILPVCLLLRRCGAFSSKAFLAGGIIAGPVLAIQGWYQTQILELELARGAYHHILFGDLSALAVAIVLAGLLTLGHKGWHYTLGLLSISAGIGANLLSGARNAWLFLALLALMLPWLYRGALGKRQLAWLATALVLFVVTMAVWRPPLLAERLADGIDDLRIYWQDPSQDTSWGARLALWRNSLVIFSESPLLGTGIGDFREDNVKLAGNSFSYMATRQFSHAHSVYFHALAEMGIVGFAVLTLSLFVLPLRYFYIHWHDATTPEARFCGLAGLLSVFAFAVFGIGETWLVRNAPVNAYVISVAVFIAGLSAIENRPGHQEREIIPRSLYSTGDARDNDSS